MLALRSSLIASCFALFTVGCLSDSTTAGGDSGVTDTGAQKDSGATADAGGQVDTVTPPQDTVTPPQDTVTPPQDTVTPPQDTVTPPQDTATPDTIVIPPNQPTITGTHTTAIGDWSMNPGKEATKCVVKRLNNATEAWVQQIRTVLAKGSHHMIIYKSTETDEQTTPFDCTPFVETLGGETFPLMITQIKEETLTFPNGVAFKFEPNQMVRIEAHFLNYFPDPITAHGDVHFDTIAAEDVVSEANMLFYGMPDFNIPANSSFTTDWQYLSVPQGTEVFAVTGHTHQLGTNVEISKAAGDSDTGTPIYPDEAYSWDEPPVTYYDPALMFGEGEGFRYRCSWDNTSNSSVGFGESANKEMCFLWAYYYPSDGYRVCINAGSYGASLGITEVCCPGHFICGLISDYLQ